MSSLKGSFNSREEAEAAATAAVGYLTAATKVEGAPECPFEVLILEARDAEHARRLAFDHSVSPAVRTRLDDLEQRARAGEWNDFNPET
jgi:hypothetical protein